MKFLSVLIMYLLAGLLFSAIFCNRIDVYTILLWPLLLIGFIAILIYDEDMKYIDKEDN